MNIKMPMYCPTCRVVYPTPLELLPDMPVTFYGNMTFQCPKGHTSKIPPSTIDVRNGILHITNAAGSGPLLDQLRKLAADAVAGKSDPGDTVKKITALAPELAPIFK